MLVRLLSRSLLVFAIFLNVTAWAELEVSLSGNEGCEQILANPASQQWSSSYPQLIQQYQAALTLVSPSSDKPVLSIVIPAYKEAQRIGESIRQIKKFFETYNYPVEILVRIEKSPDQTVEVVQSAIGVDSRFKLAAHPVQKGKGYAVRQGMLAAQGDYVLFMDADLSTPLPEIFHFLAVMASAEERSPILIGDRHHPESTITTIQPWHRQLMGATFRKLTTAILSSFGLKGIYDTQCGFKMFTHDAAQNLFIQAQNNGFAFDIEMLLLAAQQGYNVKSLPILWHDDPRSTVHPIRDPLKMLQDTIRIQRQLRQRQNSAAS